MFAFLSFIQLVQSQEVCRGLAMQGGGSHGAYEAGVIYQLTQQLPEDEVKWHWISGVSTGAMNSYGSAAFSIGQERQLGEFLKQEWMNITGFSQVVKLWPHNPVYWLFYEPSLVSNENLESFLKDTYDGDVKRNVSVGASNIDDVSYQIFHGSLGINDFRKAALASSAIPAFYPHITIDGKTYVDGGVFYSVDIKTPIEECRKLVENDSKIFMDVILDYYVKEYQEDTSMYTTFEVWEAAYTIKQVQQSQRFYYKSQEFYPDVNFRIISPSIKLAFPFLFTPEQMQSLVDQGIEDAKAVLEDQHIIEPPPLFSIIHAD